MWPMSINQKQRSWESEHSPQRRGAAALRGIGGAERQQNSNNFQKTSLCDPCKAVPWIQTELPIGVSLCCRHGGEARGFVTPDLRSALGHLGQLHHLFPSLCPFCREPGISHGGRVYTSEISKCYESHWFPSVQRAAC